jgi:hypothetical protein
MLSPRILPLHSLSSYYCELTTVHTCRRAMSVWFGLVACECDNRSVKPPGLRKTHNPEASNHQGLRYRLRGHVSAGLKDINISRTKISGKM